MAENTDGCNAATIDEHNPATNPGCDYAPTAADLAVIRAHLVEAEDLWLWREGDTERGAGYGIHMSQMLARLPLDQQTVDMQTSIEQLITNLRTLVDRG